MILPCALTKYWINGLEKSRSVSHAAYTMVDVRMNIDGSGRTSEDVDAQDTNMSHHKY